jgi:hypothetical protein
MSICDLLTAVDVASASGMPARLDEGSSRKDSCVYDVGLDDADPTALSVVFRLEGVDTDLSGPMAGFPSGQTLAGVGDAAYWSPDVSVLWFLTGSDVYAVQLLQFEGGDADALALAQRLAHAALARIRR